MASKSKQMTDAEVIAAITTHSLAIRQIPPVVVHLYHPIHQKPGDTLVEVQPGKYLCRHETVPKYAGWWMCQQCTGTGSMMRWDIRHHNLARTLQSSITKYLESLASKEQSDASNKTADGQRSRPGKDTRTADDNQNGTD